MKYELVVYYIGINFSVPEIVSESVFWSEVREI